MTTNRNPASQSKRTEEPPIRLNDDLTVEVNDSIHDLAANEECEPHDEYENDIGESIVESAAEVSWLPDGSRGVALDWGYNIILDRRMAEGLDIPGTYFDRLKERIDHRRRGRVGILRYNLDTHKCWYIPDDDDDEEPVRLPSDRE